MSDSESGPELDEEGADLLYDPDEDSTDSEIEGHDGHLRGRSGRPRGRHRGAGSRGTRGHGAGQAGGVNAAAWAHQGIDVDLPAGEHRWSMAPHTPGGCLAVVHLP